MKNLLTLSFILVGSVYYASAQLQIDKQLQMTGGNNTDRRITNVGDPNAASDAVNAGIIQRNALTYAAATGSGGNYFITLTPAPSAYSAGMIVSFKANHSNTGAATIQVGALAAISIKTGVVNDLAANDISADQMVSVMYDGTNFQLLSSTTAPTSLPPSGAAGGDLSGTYPNPDIAANAITSAEIANGTIATADIATTGVAASTYNNVTVNAQGQVTAGSNVSYLTSETDGSITNEGSLTVGAGSGTTSLLQSNTSGSTNVTFSAGTGISLGEPGSNTISITNSSPDQTVAITGAGINIVTGTYPNFTITGTEADASITNEGALTVGAGSGTTSLLQSNTSGSTNVTFSAGTGISLGEPGSNTISITNSSPDQTVAITGAGINVVTGTYPNFTVTGTEVDGSITNEGSLSVGAGTATSSLIQSNTSGSATISLISGNGTTISESGNNITIASNYTTTFVHWGTSSCPGTSSLIYSGYAASGYYSHGGSGRNYLCLTDAPSWSGTTTPGTTSHETGLLYAVEFETGASDNNSIPGFSTLNNREALCAACLVTAASSTLMVPGTTQCPTGWTQQYWGWLMSTRYNQGASDFVCVSPSPTAFGNTTNSDGALWYAVEIRAGAFSSTNYSSHSNREVVCAICTR